MGLTPSKFKKHKALDGFFKIVSTSKDRKNRKFVSTIEGNIIHFMEFNGIQKEIMYQNELAKFKNELKKIEKSTWNQRRLYSKVIDCWN